MHFQLKLSFSIFVILMLIHTALSHAVDTSNQGCGQGSKCEQDAKQGSSYVESNKKLTHVTTRVVQHQQTDVNPSGHNVHSPSPSSHAVQSHTTSEETNKALIELLKKFSQDEVTHARPASHDVQHHSHASHDGQQHSHSSHVVHHHSVSVNSNNQMNQLLIQLLVKMVQQQTTTVRTPCGYVPPRDNSFEINRLLQELLVKFQQQQSNTNVSNQQTTQLLIQLLLKLSNQQVTAVNSPCSNVQPPQQNSAEINRQLTELLTQLSRRESAPVYPQTIYTPSSQIPAELPRREPPVVLPGRDNVQRPARPVNNNKKLVPIVTGLVKHELDDVEDLVGDVTSVLI